MDPPTGCAILTSVNEGILLHAEANGAVHYLHFYYSRTNFATFQDDRPIVAFLSNGTVHLTYNNKGVLVVPGTHNASKGLLEFSEDITQFMNSKVTVTWEQNAYNTQGEECDVWSLDNVVVKQSVGKCETSVFSRDFTDPTQRCVILFLLHACSPLAMNLTTIHYPYYYY